MLITFVGKIVISQLFWYLDSCDFALMKVLCLDVYVCKGFLCMHLFIFSIDIFIYTYILSFGFCESICRGGVI